ncbi:hypothetical protein PTSG_02085 [Salpingoeca rosetta]|uniref:Rab-GAP TBC domain-containing protein n=1 Tax=Salpingoeca rosetta (strain ATCC 50818 / BSB-021) TaxID=946362 RepID=F2U2L1_SALR5|nr:uncharacterized protein PTSG_02085 [Salpingoeca rosetta]EGD81366.1 hypothetical protein PTSG_02085 [Salpingoeca rosetta]|eukprot:XP_004996570.1 hypothetical protein PTSG_02085 [Salpingoeca rosetta]
MYAAKIRHSVEDTQKLTIEDVALAKESDNKYSLWFTTADGNLHKSVVHESRKDGFSVSHKNADITFRMSRTRPSSMCLSPDHRFLLIGHMDGQLVAVDSDLRSSTLLGRVRSGAPISTITYDEHHCCFWVCSSDLALTAWDANTLLPICSVFMQPPDEPKRRSTPYSACVRLMKRLILVSTGTALVNAMIPPACLAKLKAPRPQRQNLPSDLICVLDNWLPTQLAFDGPMGNEGFDLVDTPHMRSDAVGSSTSGTAEARGDTSTTNSTTNSTSTSGGGGGSSVFDDTTKGHARAGTSASTASSSAHLHMSASVSLGSTGKGAVGGMGRPRKASGPASLGQHRRRSEKGEGQHMLVAGATTCEATDLPTMHTQLHVLFSDPNMSVHSFTFGKSQELWCGSHVSSCLFVYDIGMRKLALSWLVPCAGITAIHHHANSIFVGTKEGMTYAWDANTHAPLMQISFHMDMVRCFANTSNVLVSVSGSGDSSIVFCNTAELLKRKCFAITGSSAVVDGDPGVPQYAVDRYGFYRMHVRTNIGPSAGESEYQHLRATPDTLAESYVAKHSVLLEQAALSLADIERTNEWDELSAYVQRVNLHESAPGDEVERIRQHIEPKTALFRQGIPEEHRVTMWKFLVRLRTHPTRKFKKPGYYKRMLEYKGTTQTPLPEASQIEVDLRRTFPNNIHFQNKDQPLMMALNRILRAFGWHNRRIGYCQGLGLIAGYALLVLEEEDAFWALTTIVEDIMTWEYYSSQLRETQIDMAILDDLMEHYLPDLHKHFHNVNMDTTCYVKWFVPAFVDVFPPFITFLIWDAFLLEGREILFRFALAIFKYHYDSLMSTTDDSEFHSTIKRVLPQTTDSKRLLAIAYAWDDLSAVIARSRKTTGKSVRERIGSEAPRSTS